MATIIKTCSSIICSLVMAAIGSLAAQTSESAYAGPRSSWVKLCDTAKFTKPGDQISHRKICLTHHERLDGNTGKVLVSAAIREIQGERRRLFMIMAPNWVKRSPGVQVKIDNGRPHRFGYANCHAAGCIAQMNLTPRLLQELKSGRELILAVINRSGKAIGFPIRLNGFAKALAGPPIDNSRYHGARRRLLDKILSR